jgi:chromosome segregation protein
MPDSSISCIRDEWRPQHVVVFGLYFRVLLVVFSAPDMHLKSLTVLGFKSFADKTALTFQPGITAIVGPNGCGKSNVADAVRWVLGEQSAKALRGGEMADVIFTGTDRRKPLGMAEVSLTISDVEPDQLKAAGVELSYNEVTVTRRVFRDGGSEYFINRTPCRLKDIQQLFMGTGVGRTSYSIMAQGNITQILSSKPEDRRLVFEEAAGITRFKVQKREALRKLESTEQNLLRVSDLIREVKRQIGSLQRQAGKARRYKQISVELQHLDTQYARHLFDEHQTELAARLTALEQVRNETERSSEGVLQHENELTQLRERWTGLEHEISRLQQQSLELRNQVDHHQSRIQFNEQRLVELQQQQGAAHQEIAQADERRAAAEQEQSALATRLAEARHELDQHRQVLHNRQEVLQQLDRQLGERRAGLRAVQAQSFSAAQELSRVRNEIQALNLQKQGNLVRLEKLSSEKIQLEEERTRLEGSLDGFAASVEAEKRNAESHRGSVTERQHRLSELQSQLNGLAAQLDGLVRQQAAQKSRLHVLEQLQADHEGYGAGALAALQQTAHVLGSLADRLRVPEPYVTAIEAALGHHLQLVLTHEPETAQEILVRLDAAGKGRACLAPLALFHAGPELPASHEACGDAALAVVEADPAVQPLLQRLLGTTRIVPDLGTATTAWRNGGSQFSYVTPKGDILSRDGVYTGGAVNGQDTGKAPGSILGRKNQMAELSAQLAQLQERIEQSSRQKGTLVGEQMELQASLQIAQSELRAQEFSIASHEGEVKALQQSLRLAHQKIETVIYEIQSLARQEEETQNRRAQLNAQLSSLEDQERTCQADLQTATTDIESLQQQRETANTALTESRIAVATAEQVAGALARQQAPLEERIRELDQRIARRRADIDACSSRNGQSESEIEESRQRIESLTHQRDQVSHQVAGLLAQRETLETEIAERDGGLREGRRQLTRLQEERAALDLEIAQRQMNIQNLRDRIQQKYHLNLDDIRSECITITFADQGPARVTTLTPEEMEALGVSTDWTAVADQVNALQQRLDEMGPVNLVAIEEYEETEQRHQFLTQQHDDLVQAKTQLVEVLQRINTQTRELFLDTFQRIRDNFRVMFTEVFGGGKADLRLVDEGDVLESGIDIVARPPGKQLQSISLLSGGEQTMTAVALLFAIYQVKPSPFCVLDELDAPLDESNINRFIRILQRFLAHSQFIIITHNKRTIGMADVLYGITMEEQGVSKVVSVKFHKTSEPHAQRSEEPSAPTAPAPSVEEEEDQPHARKETLEVVLS